MAAGGCDRISQLSDDVLGSILTLIPAKEAARTAALSSRWRFVWHTSPLNLGLCDLLDLFHGSLPSPSGRPWAVADAFSRHTGPVRVLHYEGFDPLREPHWSSQTPSIESLCEAFDSKLIHHLHFAARSKNVALPQALLSGGSLSTLVMENCHFDNLAAVLPCLLHLKELHLCGAMLELGEDHLAMISRLSNLVKLKLSQCRVWGCHLRSKSLQCLTLRGVCPLNSIDALTLRGVCPFDFIDAPNLRELEVSNIIIRGERINDIVSNLPRLHSLRLQHLDVFPSLHIRSTSLKRLFLSYYYTEEVVSIDTPNLGLLACLGISLDLEKVLSGLPMLHTLKLTLCTVSKVQLTSKSLQNLEISNVTIDDGKVWIIDAPTLQTAKIDHQILKGVGVEVINAPRLGTLSCFCSGCRRMETLDCYCLECRDGCHFCIIRKAVEQLLES